MGNPWIEHVQKYAKSKKISYRLAISQARASYKGGKTQTKKDKRDEAKGLKGQVKGTKSKSKKNFLNRKETVKLDGKKVTFQKGGLHRSLDVPEDYTFKKSELNKAKKVKVGEMLKFKGQEFQMTNKLKKQITLALTLMK